MSVPMISCPMCANPMPANAQYCPTCGHTNAFVSPQHAIPPSTPPPGADQQDSAFVTPMPPPEFRGSGEPTGSDARQFNVPGVVEPYVPPGTNQEGQVGEIPQAGVPTINIGSSGEMARYAPPPASPEQPAPYNPGATQGSQPYGQPPAYSPNPMPPAYGQQPQYPPTTPSTQPYGQTQGLQQYGAQQYPQPQNYQYQQQVGVAGVPQRDPTVALLLELLGYVWFLGIGHIYGGRIARGIALLISYWFYWIIVAVLFFTLVFSPIACIMAIIWPLVPVFSGLWIKRDLDRDNAMFRQ